MKRIILTASILLLTCFSYCQDSNDVKKIEIDKLNSISIIDTNISGTDKQTSLNNEANDKENKILKKTVISWDNLLSGFLGALIGLFPYFREKLRKRKLYGKIIATVLSYDKTAKFTVNGDTESISGISHRYKINLVANKDINIKKVRIYAQYDNQYVEGKPYFIKGEYANVNPNDYLQVTSRIKSNDSYLKYLNFIINKKIYNPLTKLPTINGKIISKLQLTPAEISKIEKICTPKKIKVVLYDFRDRKTTLVLDLNKHYDAYSVIPEDV